MNTITNLGVKTKFIAGLTAGLLCGMSGLADAALVTNTTEILYDAQLLSVGQNPASCVGPFSGTNSGPVRIQTITGVGPNGFLQVRVALEDATPNTIYVVDIRCQKQIGTIRTNRRGNGSTNIGIFGVPTGTSYFIDAAIPPGNGGTGAGGYGQTFIAGPFNQLF